MTAETIDAARLIGRLQALGSIGRDADGRLARLAASDADKLGRDAFVGWLEEAGLDVAIDRVGNIFGTWKTADNASQPPLLLGSHIDTVIDAGIYDGCYGVLSGLEVIETLKASGLAPSRPIAVAAFTNEEGVRFAPDMMGSLVFAGGVAPGKALASIGTDGTVLGAELARIGYDGPQEPGFFRPSAYVELHVEQGPILEREGIDIGAVATLQGLSWQRVRIAGAANHAGTTPMSMRRDAGQAAALALTFLRKRAAASNSPAVATVGCMEFHPNAINVIPSRAVFTVDLRDPDEGRLREAEAEFAAFLEDLARSEDITITTEPLARLYPVVFDEGIVRLIEACARKRANTVRRMTSGAGHDAQMISRMCPSGMIFVPSRGGISHSPLEHTDADHLVAGANVLLDVVQHLV